MEYFTNIFTKQNTLLSNNNVLNNYILNNDMIDIDINENKNENEITDDEDIIDEDKYKNEINVEIIDENKIDVEMIDVNKIDVEIIDENKIDVDKISIPYKISIPFGTIIYRDNMVSNEPYYVSITDISLFCNMVKVWTGAKNGKKIKDKNGNCKWCPNNRIEDTERSKVIAESIKTNNFLPVTYLQISQIKNNDTYLYKLWDGQHRKSAIKLLLNEVKYHDIIKSKFKCIIYPNDDEKSIKHKFVTINKSVSVSPKLINKLEEELQQDITPDDKNKMNYKKKMNYINNIANNVGIKLSITYKEYMKPSENPNLPHFNFHNTINNLLTYLKENELYTISITELYEKIIKLNNELALKYKNKKMGKQISNRLEKLVKYKIPCYLFIESNDFTTHWNM